MADSPRYDQYRAGQGMCAVMAICPDREKVARFRFKTTTQKRIGNMSAKHDTPKKLKVKFMLGLCLLWGVAFSALAGDLPVVIQNTIEPAYPGAVIKEIRKENWNGQSATEVELTTRDGVDYEVIVSDTGEILSVEAENGLPLIGGELSLGFGLLAERGIYKDVDAEYQPVPFFNYENGRFEIVTTDSIDAAYKLYRTSTLSILSP